MDKLHPIFQGFMVWAILLSKQPSWGVFSILGVEEFTTDINPLNIHKCEDQLMGHCGNRKKGQQLKQTCSKYFTMGKFMPLIAETFSEMCWVQRAGIP